MITFTTLFGWYRWKVLLFRITPESKIFQEAVYNIISDLEGVLNKSDNILVFVRGKMMEEARAVHEKNLKGFLQRCQEWGIYLNPYKVYLQQHPVSFLRHIINEGLYPDPKKIKAIRLVQKM